MKSIVVLSLLCILLNQATATDVKLARSPNPPKPNIIFILADDLGIGNVSCYGADHFKTPNIDALAKSGMRFERCFSAPNCGPSRAMVMTGRYGFRTGMTGNDKDSIKILEAAKETEIMMPKVLKAGGYVTASVGKWSQVPLGPGEWGFDEHFMAKGSGCYWKDDRDAYYLNGKKMPWKEGEYLPDMMQTFAIEFIHRHKDEPFYLYYPMSFVHSEIQPTPDSPPKSEDLFTDNIVYMDKLVGKLVAELDRLKLRDKTLIMFVGDNGVHPKEAPRSTIRGRAMVGAKGDLLEGGNRVPLIASWPGTLPKETQADNLISITDFYPTFTELAGAHLPKGVTIDGRSFAKQLLGQAATPRDWLFVMLGRKWYVRESNWKLNEAGELFDMTDAPFDEKLVGIDSKNVQAIAARQRLKEVLDELNPMAGKIDHGTGSGRAKEKDQRREDKKKAQAAAKRFDK